MADESVFQEIQADWLRDLRDMKRGWLAEMGVKPTKKNLRRPLTHFVEARQNGNGS